MICWIEVLHQIRIGRRIIIKRQGPFMEKIFRERERLGREIMLESNLRVNLIWVGWVNFNLGGLFLFGLG